MSNKKRENKTKTLNRSKLGKNSRRKGHNAERYYAKLFKDMGFLYCITARLGSRLYDNAKIDLINLPFNVQIKAGQQKNMNPGRELFSMENMIKALFPPEESVHKKPNFLIHKKDIGRGKKATEEHELVYMSFKQYQKYKKEDKKLRYLFKKVFKFELQSEYKEVVAITFEVFKERIINKFFINELNNNTTE